MNKIKTIFHRNWNGNKGVIPELKDGITLYMLLHATPTEKIDGTNIRITVRSHEIVRVEKRRNPNKIQKQKGVKVPWYIDAEENNSNDKYLFEAVKNRDYKNIQDGEWSAEVYGKNIQGNPLNLDGNKVCIFMHNEAPVLDDFNELFTETIGHEKEDEETIEYFFEKVKNYLSQKTSLIGNDNKSIIEGIVWHIKRNKSDLMPYLCFKIKNKDF